MSKRLFSDDYVHVGSVSKWHAWTDKPGMLHMPAYWENGNIFLANRQPLSHVDCFDELLTSIAGQQLYCFCDDMLQEQEFPFANQMLGSSQSFPYLSRQGKISALRLSQKRKSGFLIPASSWKYPGKPDARLLRNVTRIFTEFGYEATTPSALSEKIVRSTLSTPLNISRPSVMLRRDILNNHRGGRIDLAKEERYYEQVFQYDENKSYLHHARRVVSPFISPEIRTLPEWNECSAYATGYWHAYLQPVFCDIPPIQISGETSRSSIEGWFWTEELQDCLDAGYSLLLIREGYGFTETSDFLDPWASRLFETYERLKAEEVDEHILDIVKAMMVGFPGRCLKAPEDYHLVPIEETQEGDIPLCFHWRNPEDRKFTDFVIRPEYNKESAALSQVGSYIVMQCRRTLYHKMLAESQAGNVVISSYIDCFSVELQTIAPEELGTQPGEWKEKKLVAVWAEQNRFVGKKPDGTPVMRAPGFDRSARAAYWRRYRHILRKLSDDS